VPAPVSYTFGSFLDDVRTVGCRETPGGERGGEREARGEGSEEKRCESLLCALNARQPHSLLTTWFRSRSRDELRSKLDRSRHTSRMGDGGGGGQSSSLHMHYTGVVWHFPRWVTLV